MIEYLFNAIRVSSGGVETITAKVNDKDGNPLTEGVKLVIYDDEELLMEVNGAYDDGIWYFTFAAKGIEGRYWYGFVCDDIDLSFKQPIYFVR